MKISRIARLIALCVCALAGTIQTEQKSAPTIQLSAEERDFINTLFNAVLSCVQQIDHIIERLSLMITKNEIKSKNILFESIQDDAYVYFVHSYYVEPKDKSFITTETDYGISFCSSIGKDNIWATQFHPEKSQTIGLQILKNFTKFCAPHLFS